MSVLHLKIPLSDDAIAYLNEIIADDEDSTTPGHWLFTTAIKPGVKQTAQTRNLLRARGSLTLPNGKKLVPADLDIGPLESFPEGTVDIIISDRVKGWIEEAAGYVSAANRLQDAKLAWTTPQDWVREICLAAIATSTADIDATEFDAEEKELYPPAKKDAA